MEIENIKKIAEEISFSDLRYIEYYFNKKDFESGGNIQINNNGNIYRLIDSYYKGPNSLLKHIKEKEEEIIEVMKSKNICEDIGIERLALKLFKNDYKSKDEYIKYNLLGWKVAFTETLTDFIKFIQDDSFYLTRITIMQIKFIEKLLFDANCICYEGSYRRKRIMPGIELLPVYEETIRGYMVSDFARPSTSIFIMRQIIELKIKRTLGIEYIFNTKNKREEVIKLSKLLNYIEKKEKSKEIISPVSIKLLKTINYSTNTYIHTGNFNNILSWHEKIGQLVLRNLCFKENEHKTHIEGSFVIKKSLLDILESDLIKFFNWDSNIKCSFSKPEATIVE